MPVVRCKVFERSTFSNLKYVVLFFTISMLLMAGCNGSGGGSQPPGIVHFVPNSLAFWSSPANWTTSYGPAFANISLGSSNFLPCRGGPFALCYYSGPSSGPEDLSCTLTPDGHYANCQCFDIPYGVYFVDINAILNYSVYQDTISQCGTDGSLCATTNSAPVCQAVNQGNLIPGTSLYSAFSFDCIPTNGIGQTNCSRAPYVGCMTAPCFATDQPGIVQCSCPVFDGPYQVGQDRPGMHAWRRPGVVGRLCSACDANGHAHPSRIRAWAGRGAGGCSQSGSLPARRAWSNGMSAVRARKHHSAAGQRG